MPENYYWPEQKEPSKNPPLNEVINKDPANKFGGFILEESATRNVETRMLLDGQFESVWQAMAEIDVKLLTTEDLHDLLYDKEGNLRLLQAFQVLVDAKQLTTNLGQVEGHVYSTFSDKEQLFTFDVCTLGEHQESDPHFSESWLTLPVIHNYPLRSLNGHSLSIDRYRVPTIHQPDLLKETELFQHHLLQVLKYIQTHFDSLVEEPVATR